MKGEKQTRAHLTTAHMHTHPHIEFVKVIWLYVRNHIVNIGNHTLQNNSYSSATMQGGVCAMDLLFYLTKFDFVYTHSIQNIFFDEMICSM